MPDEIVTRRALPVIMGHDQKHVMGLAEIRRQPDGKVTIQVEAIGEEGRILGEFLEQAEPIALSFDAIPVQNIREKREKT